MAIAFVRSLQRASSSLLRSSYPLLISARSIPQSREFACSTSTFFQPTISTICRRNFSHGTVNLVISEGKPKFETRELDPPKKWKWLTKKRLKLKRKKEREERNAANRKDPRRLTVKGKKKKRKFANPEERIKHKLERAKIKEASLVEKLKRYEVAKMQGPEVRPHEITGEERFYLKKMGQKRSNYVPIGRRGVFGGVILNMHMHWKKHETVKVICNNSKPGQVQQYAEELAKLSGGVPVNIIGDDTIVFYRGKGYVQPKVMCMVRSVAAGRFVVIILRDLWAQYGKAHVQAINTCNGFYCDQFTPNSNNKPKMWTENWSGWFLGFGDPTPYRPVEDLAFAVAIFYQRSGTFQNYYMYHGGTNFERTSGGPLISTSYDYDAPIDEYGLVRQPKWGHLRDLHKAIKLCEDALLATDPTVTSLGSNLVASEYKTSSGSCAAFLANIGTVSDATVTFNGNSYHLPAWSISILPDCKNVAFNTAKINAATESTTFARQALKPNADSSEELGSQWSYIKEPIGISKADAFVKPGLLEQINTTADESDYLWYSLR
ncbi:hypothetical protein F2Q70_00008950 [Brassica cretica]|uniref:beta-galactosidase n=1 Tax=Brassica cretica TaxID=69181 RepID=A0A8S9M1L7_BRACR|nr:hypothetical protein F2Q70_00008950 [Brassica cretica]